MKALILDGSPAGDDTGGRIAEILGKLFATKGYESEHIVLRDKTLGQCRGCFQCWLKTPGICVIDDDNRELSAKYIGSDLTVLLTPVTFGAYSPELKRMLDHLIANISPFFTIVNGESHHRKRYDRYPDLIVTGWTDKTDPVQETMFNHLAWRNAINFHAGRSSWGIVDQAADPEGLKIELEKLVQNLGNTSAQTGVKLPCITVSGEAERAPRKVLLLVGSPRLATSSSAALGGYVLQRLEAQGVATETLYIHKAMRDEQKLRTMLDAIDSADLCILAFPLYIDSLAAPVLEAMRAIRQHREGKPAHGSFAAIVNCGFIESKQNDHALATCAVFAEATGQRWMGGVSIGGGEGLVHGQQFVKSGGVTGPYKKALDLVANALAAGEPVPGEAREQLAKPFVPGWLHRMVGSMHWKKDARKNGVARQLDARPYQRKAG
jgi:multimeric flavodoxin WrbA